MPRKTRIKIEVSVDLDYAPGTFHNPNDWIWMLMSDFMRQHHYHPEVIHVEATNWDGEREKYAPIMVLDINGKLSPRAWYPISPINDD